MDAVITIAVALYLSLSIKSSSGLADVLAWIRVSGAATSS
jgi:hypothetical protein